MWSDVKLAVSISSRFLDSRIINRPEVIINSVDKKINEKGEFQDENSEKFMIELLKNLVSEVREQRTR